jgi:hypothetical protein
MHQPRSRQSDLVRRAAILGFFLTAGGSSATTFKSGHNRATFPGDVVTTFAYRVAQLDRQTCLGELARRNIPFQVVTDAPGVRAPVRLKGALGGIKFVTAAREAERDRLPWEVLDCRLVLALNEWTRVLDAHDVSEVVFSSGWRPSTKLATAGGEEGKRHAGALAMDVHAFRLKSGGELVVERDFHGHIDSPVCGPESTAPDQRSPEARQLRSIVCSSAELRLFQSILTPNYDVHHANHFHVEVTPSVRWFILS